MSILFLMSMFFLSFIPLWLCVICIDMKSLIDGTDYPYTEWIGLGLITFVLFISVLVTIKTLRKLTPQNTGGGYMVVAAEKDTVSTTAYLLSNALPLLAFDFTQWFNMVQFMIIFEFLAVLCLQHYRCDSNVFLELMGYRLYKCSLHKGFDDKEGITILIRRKQLNVNDEVNIQKLNDELYIGKYKASEEQP
jgi:hypothetical protein